MKTSNFAYNKSYENNESLEVTKSLFNMASVVSYGIFQLLVKEVYFFIYDYEI